MTDETKLRAAPGWASPSLDLREVRPEDLEALFDLDRRCFERGISYSRSELRRFLALPTREALAIDRNGSVIGFTIGYRPRPRIGSVVTLDVDAAHRRGGVGTALLAALLGRLHTAGASIVALEVDVTNSAAIAFYERFRFRISRRLGDYYAPGRDAFEMVVRLEESSIGGETGF